MPHLPAITGNQMTFIRRTRAALYARHQQYADQAVDPLQPAVFRRNFRLGVLNGVFYITAETLLDPTLVLVTFLSMLTPSPLLLGLLLPIRDGAWALPQIWVSGYLQSVSHKLTIYRRLSLMRILLWAALAVTINFVRDPNWLLAAFFIVFTFSSLISGLAGLPFFEVVSKTIPPERRGEFFAWRLGLGGVGSVVASIIVRWLLDPAGPLPFPSNYGLLSVLFFILATVSMIAFNQVVEPVDQQVRPRLHLSRQLKRAFQVIKENKLYRRYLTLQSAMMIAGAATPFFAVYVQQQLGGSPAMVGIYLGILTIAGLLSNALLGKISRRVRYSRIMHLATLAGIGMSGLVLLLAVIARTLEISSGAASLWLLPVFVLAGIRNAAAGVAGNSLLLNIAPDEDRSLYIGFGNSWMGIVLLSTGFSGVIVTVMGFEALFLFTIVAHLLAIWAVRSVDRILR
jgi:hypothetical protein